jgi:hypothetical protein
MDPLFRFGDALVHDECLRSHPLAAQVQQRLEEFRARTGEANCRCLICGKLITDPEDYLDYLDYLGLGHLTLDASDPLFQFNYAYFHRSCLAGWSEQLFLIRELDRLDRSGRWKGGGLKQLIKELNNRRIWIRHRGASRRGMRDGKTMSSEYLPGRHRNSG